MPIFSQSVITHAGAQTQVSLLQSFKLHQKSLGFNLALDLLRCSVSLSIVDASDMACAKPKPLSSYGCQEREQSPDTIAPWHVVRDERQRRAVYTNCREKATNDRIRALYNHRAEALDPRTHVIERNRVVGEVQKLREEIGHLNDDGLVVMIDRQDLSEMGFLGSEMTEDDLTKTAQPQPPRRRRSTAPSRLSPRSISVANQQAGQKRSSLQQPLQEAHGDEGDRCEPLRCFAGRETKRRRLSAPAAASGPDDSDKENQHSWIED